MTDTFDSIEDMLEELKKRDCDCCTGEGECGECGKKVYYSPVPVDDLIQQVKDNASAHEDFVWMSNKCDRLQSRCAEDIGKFKELREQLNEANATIARLRIELDNFEDDNKELRDRFRVANGFIEMLTGERTENRAEIARLTAMIDHLTHDNQKED